MKKIFILLFLISTVNLQSQITLTAKNITTCSAADGAIYTKIASNGSPPYTFQWSNGSTNAYIENLEAGNYCLTVTDAYCCAASGCVQVKDESKSLSIGVEGAVVQATNCSAADGSYTVTKTTINGVAPYTYEWFKATVSSGNVSIGTGLNPPALKKLLPGVYYLVASDANGCKATSSDIFINSNNSIALAFDEIRPCKGQNNGQLTAIVTKVRPGELFSFTWSNGLAPTANATTSTQKNLTAGLYFVEVKRTFQIPGQECPFIFKHELKPDDFQSNSITAKIKNACKGKDNGTISLDYSKFGTPYTVTWASPIPASSQNGSSQSNLAVGSYTVTVTNHCGNKAVKTFEVKEVGNITVSMSDNPCGKTLTATLLNGTPGITYIWQQSVSTPMKGGNPFDATGYGSYSVTATDGNGCIVSKYAAATVPAPTNYSVSFTEPCKGIANSGMAEIIIRHFPRGSLKKVFNFFCYKSVIKSGRAV